MARRSVRSDSSHTILVVDDQQETLQSVSDLLERDGHRVLVAGSGSEALDLLKSTEIHLVIVDYLMPRMNGAEFVREVRRFDPFVQIILQTGYAGEQPPRRMLAELDIQGYHDKSDDPERLLLWVDVGLKTFLLVKSLRDRERMQSELVANCSHEFRTPLNIIIGWAEVLLDGHLGAMSDDAAHSIRGIERAARSLNDIVVDFLQYAKLDAGLADVAREPVDVAELAREMQRLAALLLEGKDVEFAADVASAPAHLVTDGIKLRTIVRNLLTNAIKFTSEGRIELRVRRAADGVRVEVCDTGCGIRSEDRELIFEPFRQLDGSHTRERGGIGLGLALSRRLARSLGGDLRVDSVPGAGSTFALVLPSSVALEMVGSNVAIAGQA
ncbi:MAG TPA: hybrid sensor histidine kinase/response regulator [Candidatus Binatia bacterium]|nr:hybrid sensor histidine kinase/response regulator [Candidatus Binatia bacterium]